MDKNLVRLHLFYSSNSRYLMILRNAYFLLYLSNIIYWYNIDHHAWNTMHTWIIRRSFIPVLMSKAQAPCFNTNMAVAAASTSSDKLSLAQIFCGVWGETAAISFEMGAIFFSSSTLTQTFSTTSVSLRDKYKNRLENISTVTNYS